MISKTLAFCALATPLAWLVYAVAVDVGSPGTVLGADPQEAILLHLGEWALRLLLLGLALSSLTRRTKLRLVAYRRMTGLFAFTYVTLHLFTYLWLFAGWSPEQLTEDLVERTYITVGFLAWLALIPLAATSTNASRRRLGPRWRVLHRLVYAIVALGLVHVFWLTKGGYLEPLVYAFVFVILVVERLLPTRRGRPVGDTHGRMLSHE